MSAIASCGDGGGGGNGGSWGTGKLGPPLLPLAIRNHPVLKVVCGGLGCASIAGSQCPFEHSFQLCDGVERLRASGSLPLVGVSSQAGCVVLDE